jgi:hypothetical protein
MYSYGVIKAAAAEVQKEPRFATTEMVRQLRFSTKWVRGFIKRAGFKRRRCTTEDKSSSLPPAAVIQRDMASIRDIMEDNNVPLVLRINADETGIKTQESPTHQCVPARQFGVKEVPRATMAPGNQKLRITFVIAGTASGVILPTFSITKCSITRPDMTTSVVLDNMVRGQARGSGSRVVTDEFATAWSLLTWSRTMQPPKYTKPTLFSRKYLIHKTTGDIITVQHKAWNDSVGKSRTVCAASS